MTPETPVFLTHASGHASLANGRALEIAGVTASTPSLTGGEIIKGPEDEPTGVLIETAEDARFRVEHAQHIDPSDVSRFGELEGTAAMQGIHMASDIV